MFIRLLLFFAITFISVHSYSQNTDANKINVNPKARELTDSAVRLVTDDLNHDKVIDLLNQALKIDSNYLAALFIKFSFEGELKQYDKAIITANHILKLQPNVFTIYFSLGIDYLLSGDTISSQKNFNEAEIQINAILDTVKSANSNYNDLLLNKALILIYKDSTQASDSILSSLIRNSKFNFEKELYSKLLHKTKEQLMNGSLDSTQTTVMSSSNAVPPLDIDTVKFCGKKDIRKYKFQSGFYLLKEDYSKSKGFIVSDTNEYYFIAKNITLPLSEIDSVSKVFDKHFKSFVLNFYFKDSAVKELSDFSMMCLNHKAGLLLNNKLINAGNVLGPIDNGALSLVDLKKSEHEIDNLIQSIDTFICKK